MAFVLTDLDALDAAIASGELRVRYADKEVTYRSVYELTKARSLIVGELTASGLISSSTVRGGTTLARISMS